MGLYLGDLLRSGNKIYVSDRALNPSILLTGLSGSGKSWKLFELEKSIMESGNQLLIFDFHDSHQNGRFWEKVENQFEVNRINVYKQGIPLSILSPLKMTDGSDEQMEDVADAVLRIFSNVSFNLGSRQSAVLRQAVMRAVQNRQSYVDDEIRGIDDSLKFMDDPRADGIREKLWLFLNKCKISTNSGFLKSGVVNVFDLNSYAHETQEQVADFILSVVWRHLTHYGVQKESTLYLVCDEAHNLSTTGVLSKILREGRKYHVGILLATQTLQTYRKDQRAMLEQTATKLYFRPAGTEALQLATGINAKDKVIWRDQLLRLRTGQCVAIGSFTTSTGVEIHRPLVLST